MGGLVQSKGDWDPWTGGKPLSSWTGLDAAAMTMYQLPNQLRPTYASSAQKGYNYCKEGLTKKFDHAGDLSVFQTSMMKHFKDTGMDTITYLPHPKDSTDMVSVITHHSSFSIDSVRDHSAVYKPKYDEYDQMNDNAAKECLLASLEGDLSTTIQKKCLETDSFVIVWMLLLQTCQSTDYEVYNNLKIQIKSRKASQYSGQDLTMLAEDFRDDAKVLSVAGFYDHSLTLDMLKIFLEAGGEGKSAENFRFALRGWVEKAEQAILKIRFMEKADKDKHMEDEELTYRHICEKVEIRYRSYKDKKEWIPAKNVPDSRAPPSKFGANMIEDKPLTRTEFMTLMQSGFAKQEKPCYECGEVGHWKRDCPKLKGKTGGQQPRQQRGRYGQSQRTGQQAKSWKLIPPGQGQPQSKFTSEGKAFHWCAKCKRWSTTHGTAEHTGKSGPRDSNPQANMFLVPDPSAWNVEFPARMALFAQLVVGLPSFLLAMFLGGLSVFLAIGDVATAWNFIASFLVMYGAILWHMARMVWIYTAPILWFFMFIWSLWWRPDPEADDRTRRERREVEQYRRSKRRPRLKYASISDYNFHRSYP